MKVGLRTYSQWREECELLQQMHFLEVMAPRGAILGIDHELFEQMGDALRIIVATNDNGIAIGYVKTVVCDSFYDESRLTAQTLAFFLDPEYRATSVGGKPAGKVLLDVAEADLRAFAPGALWRLAIPIDGDRDVGMLLQRGLHMKPVERVYEKTLGGDDIE